MADDVDGLRVPWVPVAPLGINVVPLRPGISKANFRIGDADSRLNSASCLFCAV